MSTSRSIRSPAPRSESSSSREAVPFLRQELNQDQDDTHLELADLEGSRVGGKKSSNVGARRLKGGPFEYHYTTPRSSGTPAWRWRLRRATSAIFGRGGKSKNADGPFDGQPARRTSRSRRSRSLSCILQFLAASLMLLGFLQVVSIAVGIFGVFFPDDLDWVVGSWSESEHLDEGLTHWPTDFSGGVKPVACHSHNDYWRKEPLYSAIRAGCTGVEADVWLFEDELFVGHSLSSLTPNRTLRSLYINPLLNILEKQNPITEFHRAIDSPPNGIFDTAPSQALVLLIDFKTAGDALWPVVESELDPLRELGYLTHFNGTSVVDGPITVVATGNAPFDLLTSNHEYRDIFFDAPLDKMSAIDPDPSSPFPAVLSGPGAVTPSNSTSPLASAPTPISDTANQGQGHSGNAPTDPTSYSPANSYYASVSFSKSIGYPWRSRLSHSQITLLRQQIRGAHSRGLKVRYWSIPAWPRGLRNYIWRVLIREGVDMLNVDDLKYAVSGDWGPRKGGWGGKWWG